MSAPQSAPSGVSFVALIGTVLAILSIVLAVIGAVQPDGQPLVFVVTLLPGAAALILWMVRLGARVTSGAPAPVTPIAASGGRGLAAPGAYPPTQGWRPPPPTSIYGDPTRALRPQVDPDWLAKDPFYSALETPQGSIRCFIAPKHDASDLIECEDSYALGPAAITYAGFGPGQPTRFALAVADGVGGSELPRPWGRLLAHHFVTSPDVFLDAAALAAAVPGWGREWATWVTDTWFPTLNGRAPNRDQDIDFYRRLGEGAQATLVGCTVEAQPDESVRVTVLAVGDSDCFIFGRQRGGFAPTPQVFPVTAPSQFNPNPATFVTNPSYAEFTARKSQSHVFMATTDDVLVLATDSLSEWLLEQGQRGGELWTALLECPDDATFKRLIAQARAGADGLPALKDDDVTLIIVPLHAYGARKGGRAR